MGFQTQLQICVSNYILYYTLHCLPIDIPKTTYKIVFTVANKKRHVFVVSQGRKNKNRSNFLYSKLATV